MLTPRESEILKLIVNEKSSIEISEILSISNRTVETHRKNIAAKLGSSSLVAFTKYAIKTNLLKI
jgi:DNA-binding CsgD family transcriptional regulator